MRIILPNNKNIGQKAKINKRNFLKFFIGAKLENRIKRQILIAQKDFEYLGF